MGYYNDIDFENLEDELDQMSVADPSNAPNMPVGTPAVPYSPEYAVKQAIIANQGKSAQDLERVRAERGKETAIADIAQGFTQLGAGLAGQKADTTLFQAGRQAAATKASEALTDADRKRKAVSDAIRQKALGEWRGQIHEDKEKNREAADVRSQRTQQNVGTLTEMRTKRMQTQNIRAANQIMNDPNSKRETQKLTAASGAQALVDEIRSGKLKDSSNISKQLTNLIATIEMGGPGAVNDRQAMGVDTLYTRAQKLLSYVSGNPQSAIPAPYLDQLETEIKALGHRAAKNYKAITDASISGADLSGMDPDADPGQVAQLARQRQQQFLKSVGFDPETGEPVGGAVHGSGAHAAKPGGPMTPRQKRIAELNAKKAAGTLGTK